MDNNLAFDKLPKDVQTKIIELQTPSDDRYVFIPRIPIYYWIAIAAGIIWCIYMFSSTQNYLWEYWMFWLFAGGSAILISLALFVVYKIIRAKTGKLKDGFIFTKNECLKIKGNSVEFWSLRELEGFQFREDIKMIEVWIGERLVKIKAEDLTEALRLETVFVNWHNNAGESFLKPYAKNELAYNNSKGFAAIAGGIVVLLLVSIGVSYAAKIVNRNFDDAESWQRAEKGTMIGDFEEYKQRHPQGSYVPDADRRITEISSKLKDDYTSKVKKTSDEKAVKALSELLDGIGKLPNRTIYVRIKETRELDDAVVKDMRQQTGYPINTYDYSIPPTEEAFRKDKLVKDLSLVFLSATRNASVNFELSDNPPPNTTVIDLNYVARSIKSYYRYNWYSDDSLSVHFNPAAKFEFDMTLRSADSKELYKTNYISLFTNLGNTGLIDSRDAANYSFDKMYFSSVSQDFTKYLGKQFGFTE